MANFNLYLRYPQGRAMSKIVLDIRYNQNLYKVNIQIDEEIEVEFWDKKTQRPKRTGKYRSNYELTRRLDIIIDDSKEIYRRYLNDNHSEPPPKVFKDLLLEKFKPNLENQNSKITFIDFIEQFIEDRQKPQIKPFAAETIRSYKNTLRVLKNFSKASKNYRKIGFEVIDHEFSNEFTKYMVEVLNYSTNTVGNQIKNLRTFLNDATEKGININTAYKIKGFKKVSENIESVYLNTDEIQVLFDLDLSNKSKLERVRDLMIVGCWTGLRFSDFTTIAKEDIRNGFIYKLTIKTNEKVVIPIHHQVQQIMQRYYGKTNNSLPSPISNVKMNKYLKELCQLAGFDNIETIHYTKGGKKIVETFEKYELISTHTARRSFATNQYLSNFPIISLMAITGHRTEKSFLKYIKVTKEQHAKLLQSHWANPQPKLKIA